jgi:CHAT domain-containing protein/tetratricopeptide (TPR) repeat protein
MNRNNIRVTLGVFVVSVLALQIAWQRHLTTNGTSGERRPELIELVKAVGTYRPLEARLTGGFAYGPLQAPSRSAGGSQELSPDLRIAVARIEKRAARSRSDSDWVALGTSYLLSGELEKGLGFLEAAVAEPSSDALLLSDLAAAYLSVAQEGDRDDLIPKALASAERACRLNARLPEAAFNKALSLEAIHLSDQAQQAWRAYSAIDSSSPWAREAQAHLTKLERESSAEATRGSDIEGTLEAALAKQRVDIDGLRPVRHRLRTWIEATLLPAWAERELSGDRIAARERLRRARVAADLLVRAGGDPMPRDGIRTIDKSARGGTDRVLTARLAHAHLALRDALRQFDQGAVADANRTFQLAKSSFAQAHSPYLHWSTIYTAVAQYAARQFDGASGTLRAGIVGNVDERYRYLAGRRIWLAGLIAVNQGRFMESLAAYRGSLGDFESVGEWESLAAVEGLLAENFRKLGVPREAWRHELGALARLPDAGPMRRKNLILQLGSDLCLNSNLPAAALHFEHQVISTSSDREGRPSVLVEGYVHRAQIQKKLGDALAAGDDLNRARALLGRIDDVPLRLREEAEVLKVAGEIDRDTMPLDAIASTTRAIDFFGGPGGESRMTELYLARARARLVARQPDLAERDLVTAVGHFEQQRGGLANRQYRASLFGNGWQAFVEMVRLQVTWRQNPMGALDYAERGRARTLLESAANTETVEPLPVAAAQHQMPDRAAALFFVTLEDRLYVWTVRNRSINLTQRPIGAAALSAKVNRVRWLLPQPDSDGARLRTELEELFGQLIEPALPSLAGVETVVIIPDGPLHSLPFAALVNPKSGRYLVQDFVLMTAPSLSTMVRFRPSTPHRPESGLRALVVGNPEYKQSADASWLPRLPFSQEEAVNVAAMYRDALLLTAEKATKREFLKNLPLYEIVHYSGHAVVNEQTPSMSRLLMTPDENSDDDGALFASELVDVRLDKTSLVVLAACSTSVGMIGNGEGIFSIARPFLEAGASIVIGTLWDIQDRSAADFFAEFHRHVVGGENPAVALTAVQRQFLEHGDAGRRAPFQWAWPVTIGALPQ